MPQFARAQLILVEVAAAAVAGGYAARGAWLFAGTAVGVIVLAAAVVPLRRRWLYQVLGSWAGLVRRRRRVGRRTGLAGLLGDYAIESVPGGNRGGAIGVVRSGTTWSVPLALGLDDVFNDDPAVPVQVLAGLLQIEDVELSSVRLVTVTTPVQGAANAPAGPSAPLTPLAARYCVLTVDTRRAAEAVGARGGSQAAVHQILRRCAVHAEQVLATADLRVRRLDETAVAGLFGTWLGPASPAGGRRGGQTLESRHDVRVAGVWSTLFAVTGDGDVTARVARLAAAAPTAIVVTTLVLQPAAGRRAGAARATLLVRLSAPEASSHEDAAHSLALLARAYDLVLQPLDGEQGELMRATTPVGVGEEAA